MKNLLHYSLENLKLPIIISLLGVTLVFILVSFVFLNRSQKNFKHNVKDKSNTVRVYVIDVKDEKVEYFNSSKLREKKIISLNSFYSHFATADREDLITWINDLITETKDTRDFIEVDAYVNRFKKNISSILQVQKIDFNKKLIYLESYLLNIDEGKMKKKTKKAISKERLIKLIKQTKYAGFTYCINFFNKQTKTDEISNIAFAELRNIIFLLASKDIYICELNNTKFLITNFGTVSDYEASQFINYLMSKFYSYLSIGSYVNEIDTSIGVTKNSLFERKDSSLFNSIINLAEYAKDDEKQVIFYNKKEIALTDENEFKTEVSNVVQEKKMHYFYQPIYNLKYNRYIAYICSVELDDSIFKTIYDLKNFALRNGDGKKLFTLIAKDSRANFSREKGSNNYTLFLPINANELQFVNSSMRYFVETKDSRITLVLKEQDINSVITDDENFDEFINLLRSIKSKGLSVSLEIDDTVLSLSPRIYSLFDSFEVKIDDFFSKKKKSNIPVFKGLIESLLKYQKPIIALNIPTWDIVELVYKFGFTNISGDPIAGKNENIVPIDKKVIQKIKKLTA